MEHFSSVDPEPRARAVDCKHAGVKNQKIDHCCSLAGAAKSHEQTLLIDLMEGYSKDAYPVPDANKSFSRVRFGLELVQLVNVVRTTE